jgi:hypothetical protein
MPHPTSQEPEPIESVERTGLGCWVGPRVEVCALSALCALWVEVCALSAFWVEVCALCALWVDLRDVRAVFRRLLARRADSCKGPEEPENQDEGHSISPVTVSESLR